MQYQALYTIGTEKKQKRTRHKVQATSDNPVPFTSIRYRAMNPKDIEWFMGNKLSKVLI